MSLRGDLFGDCCPSCTGSTSVLEYAVAAPRSSHAGLGDAICTIADCEEGERSLLQLATFYNQAGTPQKYTAAVHALGAQFQQAQADLEAGDSGSAGVLRPCCQIKQLGTQARQLAIAIARDKGWEPPPDPAEPSFWDKLFSVIAFAVGGTLLVKAGSALLERKRGAR